MISLLPLSKSGVPSQCSADREVPAFSAAVMRNWFKRQALLGRKEILLMHATTKVDGHVNVLFEQINGPQLYRGKL